MLKQDGHNVLVLCRDVNKAKRLLGNSANIIIGDVTDSSSIFGCCDGIDVVYHMVTKVGNELPSDEILDAFRNVNVEGSRNMIFEAQRAGVKKFIYISSIAAMGIVRNAIITEESPCDPYLPYQISKREAELLILDEFKKNNFPAIIIRPAKVYGYGEREYSYLSLAKLCKKGSSPKVGFGQNPVSHLYITDLIETLRILVDKGDFGRIYTLASEFIHEGDNGFVIQLGNIDELKKAIKRCEDTDLSVLTQISEKMYTNLDRTSFSKRKLYSLMNIYNDVLNLRG